VRHVVNGTAALDETILPALQPAHISR